MPIPKPHKDEDKQKFVARCMGDDVMKKDYKDPKQRVAICLGQSKSSSIIEDVQLSLSYNKQEYDDNWDEWTTSSSEISCSQKANFIHPRSRVV